MSNDEISNDVEYLNIFSCAFYHLYIFFGEMFIHIFSHALIEFLLMLSF